MQTDITKGKVGHAPGMGGKVEPRTDPAPRTYRGSPEPLQRFFGPTTLFGRLYIGILLGLCVAAIVLLAVEVAMWSVIEPVLVVMSGGVGNGGSGL